MQENIIFHADVRKIKEYIKETNYISTTITSPPYFDMKDYGSENQIGFGQSYEEYLLDLKSVFQDIYSITKDDGTLWIIIDTFKRDGQVIPLPFDLVSKLIQIGWLLQDIIIWKKDKTVPWSNNSFVQRKFEYILFFSKTQKFTYYKDRVRVYDTTQLKKWWVKYPERYNPKGKALDEIWEYPIPIQGSWGDKYIKHFCPLPTDMVGTMIQLTSNEGEIVLDPFSGSGAVLSQAAYMKRQYVGFELNISYIEMFKTYLKETLDDGLKKYNHLKQNPDQNIFETTILNLRALKYARMIKQNIQTFSNYTIFVTTPLHIKQQNKLIEVSYIFIGDINIEEITPQLNTLTSKPPLSKFGIVPIFKFVNHFDQAPINSLPIYEYTESNTYSPKAIIDVQQLTLTNQIISHIYVNLKETDYE